MNENEFKVDMKICLLDGQHSFPTTGKLVEDEEGNISIVGMDAIRYDGKVINFGTMRVNLEFEVDGRQYECHHCHLDKIQFEGRTGYSTDTEPSAQNRRDYVRIPCCEMVIMQKGSGRSCIDANTRDISVGGIGLSIKKKDAESLIEGTKCSMTIRLPDERSVKVEGEIVRVNIDPNKDYATAGLKLDSPGTAYVGHVMNVQRRYINKNKDIRME